MTTLYGLYGSLYQWLLAILPNYNNPLQNCDISEELMEEYRMISGFDVHVMIHQILIEIFMIYFLNIGN